MKAPKKNMKTYSISRYLTTSLIVTVTFISILSIIATYYKSNADAKKNLESKADEIIDYLDRTLVLPLWDLNDEIVKMTGSAITQNEVVCRLVIKDHHGRVLFFLEKERDDDTVSRNQTIYHKGKLIGDVELALSKLLYKQDQQNLLIRYAFLTLFIILSLAGVSGFFVRTFVKKPLAVLNDIVNSYAQGRYDSNIKELPYHEFKRFGNILTQMGHAIKEHQTHLEELVKERTAELSIAKKKAEASSQAKSSFLANMSHELRTPLNAILGFCRLMERDRSLALAQQENLGIINRSGEHLLGLINDILDMSKIEAGRITINKHNVDFHQMLSSIEEMMRLRAENKGLSFALIYASDELPDYIKVDEGKLRQVLINILGNAIKFTQKGSVTTRVSRPDPEAALIRFEIEDTGPGIPADKTDLLFNPFVQLQREKGAGEGTGLGLAISKKFVQLMGGDISVESQVGQGSVFSFQIEFESADMEQIETKEDLPKIIGLVPNQPQYRILIVEDFRENRILLRKLLEMAGFKVQAAANGQEGLELYKTWQPHLIIMDMRMPIMDGYEATRRIRGLEASTGSGRIPIFALTASAFETDRKKVLAGGCDEFIRKPLKEETLFDLIGKHLGLDYIYEDQPMQEPGFSEEEIKDILASSELAQLPDELMADFKQAVIKLNQPLILKCIDRIRATNSSMGDVLARLSKDFQYEKILAFIEP